MSSFAGVLNPTTPLWTVLLAVSLRTEGRLSPRRIIGVVVGFAGAVVVVEPWSGAISGSVLGMLACLAAALSYAVAYTYQGRYLTNRCVSPITLTAVQLSIAAAMLAVTLPFGGPIPPTGVTIPWIAVVVLGIAILSEPARALLPIGAVLILLGVTLVRLRYLPLVRLVSRP